eukprot:4459817-Prymnesium_polylepis.1
MPLSPRTTHRKPCRPLDARYRSSMPPSRSITFDWPTSRKCLPCSPPAAPIRTSSRRTEPISSGS